MAEAKRPKRTFKEKSKKSRESENDSEIYTVLMLVVVVWFLANGGKSTSSSWVDLPASVIKDSNIGFNFLLVSSLISQSFVQEFCAGYQNSSNSPISG